MADFAGALTQAAGGNLLGAAADLVSFTTKRKIGDFTAQVTVEEVHTDDLTVTDHPVEKGAQISDHAFKNPARLLVTAGWSNSSLAAAESTGGAILSGFNAGGLGGALDGLQGSNYVRDIYQRILALQATREPFTVTTGKRVYENMLITSIGETTTQETENSLILQISMREVIIVETQTTTVPPRDVQANPEQTADTQNAGAKQPVPAKAANSQSLVQLLAGGF